MRGKTPDLTPENLSLMRKRERDRLAQKKKLDSMTDWERRKFLRERQAKHRAKLRGEEYQPPSVDDPNEKNRQKLTMLLLKEYAYRRIQTLNMYQPIPKQLAFHQSRAPERLMIGSNRSSKTTSCAAELAWAVTGTHPYLDYPKKNGRAICVAKDGDKIAQVFFWKLFKAGAIQLVRDSETHLLRAWNPEIDGYDRKQFIPALPLIDQRLIKEFAWERKALNWPKKVILHNGWEISFYSSLGKPLTGVDVDLCWFDEEIHERDWYQEMIARLVDRAGKFIWSATPQLGTDILHELHERAMKERGMPRPLTEEFHLLLDENPFIGPDEKEIFKAQASIDPEAYRVRILGEFLITSHRIYPSFNIRDHGCEAFDIPEDWCRYVVIDPGYTNAVATFWAVPPDDQDNDHIYVYDELYCKQVDAQTFAKRLAPKIGSQLFEAFIIDRHGSRRTEANGKTIGQQYAEAFEAHKISSISTGSSFIMAGNAGSISDTPVMAGIHAVRSWLWDRGSGRGPKLKIFHELCPNLVDEMKSYKCKTVKGRPTERPDQTKHSHGPDTIRYAVEYCGGTGLNYVKPRDPKKPLSALYRLFCDKRKKQRQHDGNYVLLGSNS